MIQEQTYEELEQRIEELKKEAFERIAARFKVNPMLFLP